MDRSFWSGAIILVTVVIAGAGALPSLLLRPATPEVGPGIESRPFASRPMPAAEPAPKLAELPKTREEPARLVAAVTAPEPVAVRPDVPGDVASQQAPPAPPSPPPAPVSRPQESSSQSFPPVQAVDLPAPAGAKPNSVPPATEIVAKPAARPQREAARHPKRQVRPAPFPLREFLAWRR